METVIKKRGLFPVKSKFVYRHSHCHGHGLGTGDGLIIHLSFI